MGKVIFDGCSVTSGTGLDKNNSTAEFRDSPELWVNLCHKNIPQFATLDLINQSKGGSSNQTIFNRVVESISKYDDIEYIVCAWTSVPRYNFNIGFELYNTEEVFHPNRQTVRSHQLNQCDYTDSYLRKIALRFLTLHDLHYEIVHLLKFINIITNLSNRHGITLINVNALCPWDDQFFKVLPDTAKPSDYTEFTQEILNISNRDDEEILNLYHLQHEQYNNYGGIRNHTWVNLYNSFLKETVDYNYDDLHAGVESNKIFFDLVKRYMQTLATVAA